MEKKKRKRSKPVIYHGTDLKPEHKDLRDKDNKVWQMQDIVKND